MLYSLLIHGVSYAFSSLVPFRNNDVIIFSFALSFNYCLFVYHPLLFNKAALAEYVEYEGRCLSMLADRLVSARTELARLQAEHEVYQGLNMKVHIACRTI